MREALDIRLSTLGEVHPQTANSLMALGQTLNLQGRNREAEAPLARAVDLRRKIYGSSNALVDGALNNLASLRHDLGDLTGAESLYREALDNQRKRLGARHPDVAVTANNLATLLEDRRSYAEAGTALPANHSRSGANDSGRSTPPSRGQRTTWRGC